jgi:hypothetical protein
MINLQNIISVEKKYDLKNNHNTYKVIFEINKVCFVPVDTANSDYQAIQKWIAEGGIVIDNAPSGAFEDAKSFWKNYADSVTEAEGGEVIDNPPTE